MQPKLMTPFNIQGRLLLLGLRWLEFVRPYYTYQCVINPPPDGNPHNFRLGTDLERLKWRFDVRLFFYAKGNAEFRDVWRRWLERPEVSVLLDTRLGIEGIIGAYENDSQWRNALAFLRGLADGTVAATDLINVS